MPKYTILYIKVRCHDERKAKISPANKDFRIISFRVLLLFNQDMREWIHFSPQN